MSFFYQDDTIKSIAYKLKKAGKKAIFFIQSVEDAHRLYKEFKDISLFLCGKNSNSGKRCYQDVDETKIENMLINQRFDEQFLITTSCFDAGANIIDTDLHTVIIDMKNVSSLIQCLGRKRSTGKDDKLNVFIKAVSNRQLGGLRTKRVESLKRADFLLKYGTRKYVEEYPRNDNFSKFYTSAIYDEPMSKRNKNTCTKKVNMMIYEKYKLDIIQCDDIKDWVMLSTLQIFFVSETDSADIIGSTRKAICVIFLKCLLLMGLLCSQQRIKSHLLKNECKT